MGYGQRRTLQLSFDRTSRPGEYALKNSWGEKGDWTLVLTNQQDGHEGGAAEVMVRVSGNRVIGVEAATKPSKFAELPLEPRRFTEAEIDASLGRATAALPPANRSSGVQSKLLPPPPVPPSQGQSPTPRA